MEDVPPQLNHHQINSGANSVHLRCRNWYQSFPFLIGFLSILVFSPNFFCGSRIEGEKIGYLPTSLIKGKSLFSPCTYGRSSIQSSKFEFHLYSPLSLNFHLKSPFRQLFRQYDEVAVKKIMKLPTYPEISFSFKFPLIFYYFIVFII